MAAEEKRAIIDKVKSGREKGQYKFVLRALNGEVIARSHPEAYTQLHSAVDTLKEHFKDFVIYEKTKLGLLRRGNYPPQEEQNNY
jgi:uncharacterized protein YegP (UPF0339 family)